MDCDVVVVGAGVAGTIAARDIGRAGLSVALLEARDRIGGRLLEIEDPRALAPIELGGEFVHGRPALTYALLQEIGATVIDNADGGFVLRDGAMQPATSDRFADVASLLGSALEREDDESVDALAARNDATGASRETGTWTRRLVSGFDAADPARASARAIAQEWLGDASADGTQSRPAGGYAPVVAHLARSLDAARVALRLQTVVRTIARGRSGITLDASENGRDFSLRARYAIVTVPHGVLLAPSGAEGALAFDPPLPAATRDAIAHIAMGPVHKIVLCFRQAFWETVSGGTFRDGAFFNGDGAFPTFWTQLPVRANILVAWAGGPMAERLRDESPNARTELALACAGRYFGNVTAAEAAFACAYAHDWQSDPFSRGAYSYALVGGEHAREQLAIPIDGALWIAGEAAASNGEGGTVAGALESGVRAARGIIEAARR
jgi:monoamine oxidase